ncbi:MAG TPA: hypothetical protein VKW08_00300 [Xanthobacteraceae bacterium]|jgi:hypothetical protein|nr:hypothetical protein [Xanthobacteraceae bacterium]
MHDPTRLYSRILIFLGIIGLATIVYVGIAQAVTVCQIGNGCTGTSTGPSYGQVLIGGKNGEYELVASSTFGGSGGGGTGFSTTSTNYWLTQQTTSGLAEGSNLYWTQTRFDNALSATTSVKAITALPSLSLPYSQLTGTPTIASSTLLIDNNTFSGIDSFTNASGNFGGTWQTFSPSHFQTALTLPLSYQNGGTGTSTAANYGNVLAWNGTNYQALATSSFGCTVSCFSSPNISQWTNNSGYLTGNQTVTLSGDVTGSGVTSIATAFNVANSHWWTARQNTTNASTSELTATSTLWLTAITNCNTTSALTTDANGKVACGAISGSGGGVGTIATSGLETAGQIPVFSTTSGYPAKVYSQSTSTPSIGSILTYSGTLGNLIGGTSGTFSIASNAVTNGMLANSTIHLNGATLTLGDTNDTITAASSTVLSDNNLFSGNDTFSASTTHQAQVNLQGASSTLFTAINAFYANGLTSCNGASNALTWNAGAFGCNSITASGSASTTLLTDNNTFTGGNLFLASTTIGDSTQNGGLTVSGSATTTGNLLINGLNTAAGSTTLIVGTPFPSFQVLSSSTNAVTGLNVVSNQAGNGVLLQTTSSGANENINITSKGTGSVNLQVGNASKISVGTGQSYFGGSTAAASAYVFSTQPSSGNLSAGVEVPTWKINTANITHTHANIATQREILFNAETEAMSANSTAGNFGELATVGITGAPLLGNWATSTEEDTLYLGGSALNASTTNSYGLTVNANTGAQNNYAAEFLGGAVGIGSSTFSNLLTLGTVGSTNGTSTIGAGKIQIDGYNTTGNRVCLFVVGTTLTITSGACIP